MYGTVKDGKLKITEGNFVSCKVEEDGEVYYITCFNPTKEELNKMGYFELTPEAEQAIGTDAIFEVSDNMVCVKNEEA